ncbi:MAG: ATP adenylyltransferase, partial [Cyanobium sp.]
VEQDSRGLWFFNSCAASGASQPHRHLQLLPRSPGELSCPLAGLILRQLEGASGPWPWAYRISRRTAAGTADRASELSALYQSHAQVLGLGEPGRHAAPQHPYNLLFDRDWFMTIRRTAEHWAGFSVNALGFAGCLLITEHSDQSWLEREGPMRLLQAVAAAPEAVAGAIP